MVLCPVIEIPVQHACGVTERSKSMARMPVSDAQLCYKIDPRYSTKRASNRKTAL